VNVPSRPPGADPALETVAAYGRIALAWRAARQEGTGEPVGRLPSFVEGLAPGARVLDLGCGCGEPVAAWLSERGFTVLGVDASPALISLARSTVPEARFLTGDMRSVRLEGRFQAVVAWDSLFHLPRDQHPQMLRRIAAWLEPEGRLLASFGGSDHPGFRAPMLGETFFYSGFEPRHTLRLLDWAGLEVEHWEISDASSLGHLTVLARRRDEPTTDRPGGPEGERE